MHFPKITRRRFLASTLAAGGAAGMWMRFVEPWWMRESFHTVPLGLGGVKLLHLSDLHADPMPLDFLARQIDRALAWKPDFICVTGDFITTKYEAWDAYASILARLPAAAPTFATLGNHDGGRWARRSGYADTRLVRELLQRSGIPLLHNTQETVEIRGQRLRLVGLGDEWADEMEPLKAFGSVGQRGAGDLPTIALSHNPDTKDELAPYAWDLMLSGHTHGGQLSLPLIGEPFIPIRDKRFVRGLYAWEKRWIHVTAGLGSLHKARFNCRPEISCLTLS
jgi:uncharacterized protein